MLTLADYIKMEWDRCKEEFDFFYHNDMESVFVSKFRFSHDANELHPRKVASVFRGYRRIIDFDIDGDSLIIYVDRKDKGYMSDEIPY